MKNYDKKFNEEISEILNTIYYNSTANKKFGFKEKSIIVDEKYVDFLVQGDFVKVLGAPTLEGEYYLRLNLKGFEVIEKYGGWEKYRKKVFINSQKLDRAKIRSIKYWWIPIVIAFGILMVAIIKLIKDL